MEKKKSFNIHIIHVGDDPYAVIRALVKQRIEMALAKNGAVADNLDEVLSKYISEDMHNEQKG